MGIDDVVLGGLYTGSRLEIGRVLVYISRIYVSLYEVGSTMSSRIE